ncbi:MAG TPA: hypothetical protein VIV11_27785 [Kofleriaceae bacterium]
MNPVAHLKALWSTWRGRFILAFLAVQLVLPLHYYLLRHDPHDERFAWRMFSPMRMSRCSARFSVDKQPVQLGTQFHEAWIEVANRGRYVVLEGMAEKLCTDNPGKPVELSVDCTYLDRPDAHFGHADMCKEPEL